LSSTPPPAPPGFQFTMAVESASATRNTPGWLLLPTGPIIPNTVSNACSPAIREWGFCATPMPATRAQLNLLPPTRSRFHYRKRRATNEHAADTDRLTIFVVAGIDDAGRGWPGSAIPATREHAQTFATPRTCLD